VAPVSRPETRRKKRNAGIRWCVGTGCDKPVTEYSTTGLCRGCSSREKWVEWRRTGSGRCSAPLAVEETPETLHDVAVRLMLGRV